ncbi:sensor domain-containing protein [Mycolicibacterium sp. P9-64]|uniref:sensor domain-containing protein n=1 Tax=Mycolicibacterium sp. P9-64 TaxID=2024612 RepID=UPI0011F0018C|nr:sensor domain-containing protein [Mycolicibacterium sp. P9-64]KAA0086498.1 sensor domain-containing protein [Mycolicibacterium sp. P9-64]
MNTPDDDRDAEMTTDWPGTQRGPAADDGEATTVVPKTPQHSTPPPMSPPPRQAPPPPMSPPQPGQWDPRWNTPPGPSSPPPPGGGAWVPPVPPGPYPPNPYPPVTPKPPKGPRWGLLGIGALALVVIAVAVTVFVTRGGDSSTTAARSSTSEAASPTASTSASSTAAAPPTGSSSEPTSGDVVPPTALKGLLASVPEITQLVDNAVMTPSAVQTAPLSGATITPDSCTGAVMPGIDSVYRGSSFTGIAVQGLNNDPQRIGVLQAIASFPSAAEAQSFVDGQFADWQACKYTDITQIVGNGEPQHAKVAISANTLGTNNVFIFPPTGTDGRQCQHAMSARKNTVVDVRVCTPSVGSMGWTLARDIGAKITGQR